MGYQVLENKGINAKVVEEHKDKIKNLRGLLYEHYDSSGKQWTEAYDFKGNAPENSLQLLLSPTLTDADWSLSPPLSSEIFTTASVFDALNRPVSSTNPGGNIHEFSYDRGGALKAVELNSNAYVQNIHYDAKGQRLSIWYGNATKTKYEYDPLTFTLRRLLTTGNTGTIIYQDLNYWYDPVGNITEIQDDAQQTLYFNNSVVAPTQRFTYDALYRLIESKGRELIANATFGAEDNWNDNAWKTTQKGNGNDVQNYTQHYTYDAVGNILELQHIAGSGSYTRTYEIDTDNNRLLSTTVGTNTYYYTHDVRGNMTEMPHLDAMYWNIPNEQYRIENGTMEAYYQYAGGERIRKWVDKGNIKEERIYLGNFEIYRKFDGSSSLTLERQTVHVSDDSGRIAMLETRTFGTDPSPATLERYIYSNHLQSASLELDASGDIISYEEYHPYGTTSYQAMNASINAVAKRYRYTGKERDEESGLYYHGARYYVPWLCRWSAVDPINSENYNLAKGYGLEKNKERHFLHLTASPYEYCLDNPINNIDANGEQGVPPNLSPYPFLEQEWNRMIREVERTTTETIDKSFKTLLISTAYAKAPELILYDFLGIEMSEERKQEIFDTDFEASVGILLYEFATGTGKEVRDFYYSVDKPNSFANKIVEGYVFKDTVQGLYNNVKYHFYNSGLDWNTIKNDQSKKYQFDIEFSPDQTGIRIDKSVERHIVSNAAQFFLGGATGYVRPTSDNTADVVIINKTSRSSLMLHMVQDDYYIGDLRNIEQRIHFSVNNLDKTKTSNYQSNEIDQFIYQKQWLRKTIDAID